MKTYLEDATVHDRKGVRVSQSQGPGARASRRNLTLDAPSFTTPRLPAVARPHLPLSATRSTRYRLPTRLACTMAPVSATTSLHSRVTQHCTPVSRRDFPRACELLLSPRIKSEYYHQFSMIHTSCRRKDARWKRTLSRPPAAVFVHHPLFIAPKTQRQLDTTLLSPSI